MVAPRKKTSGFSAKPVEKTQEEVEIDALIDAVTDDVFQNLEKVEEVAPAPAPIPVVIESIVPTEDSGPRFKAEPAKEKKEPKKPALLEVPDEAATRVVKAAPAPAPAPALEVSAPVAHPPKRNPRNVPRFSRFKKV